MRLISLLTLLALFGCSEQLFPTPVPQPQPTPIINPQPVPATGFRVLIVYESDANNSREVLNTLNSTAILELLNARCESWRKWDKTSIDSTGLADEEPEWRAIWKQVSTSLGSLPKLVTIRGGKASVTDLPATEAETLSLIRKAGE
mgnify:CR=1 FL=1